MDDADLSEAVNLLRNLSACFAESRHPESHEAYSALVAAQSYVAALAVALGEEVPLDQAINMALDSRRRSSP